MYAYIHTLVCIHGYYYTHSLNKCMNVWYYERVWSMGHVGCLLSMYELYIFSVGCCPLLFFLIIYMYVGMSVCMHGGDYIYIISISHTSSLYYWKYLSLSLFFGVATCVYIVFIFLYVPIYACIYINIDYYYFILLYLNSTHVVTPMWVHICIYIYIFVLFFPCLLLFSEQQLLLPLLPLPLPLLLLIYCY